MPRWDAVGFFCEDIRQEANSVETIVGVMPDNIALQGGTQGFLPRLAMYVRIHLTTDVEVDVISVTADFFDGMHHQQLGVFDKDKIVQEKETARRSGATTIGLIFRGIFTPFPVPRLGSILLKARVGEEEITCGGLHFTSSSSAPPPQAGTAPTSS
jgi:hypothetical protein